jgi:nucleotide-binding universal stress UspA family protein
MSTPMFARILIDIDVLAADHPAIDQGLDFAARAGSAVTLVDTLPDFPPAAMRVLGGGVEQELVEHRRQRLAAIAGRRPASPPIETRLLRGKPSVAIVQEVLRGRHDLVIRSHGRELGETPPFGPVDLQLLRTCPCPVWLVARTAVAPPRRLLAAVDVSDPAPDARAFSQAIVELAAAIRTLEDGELTVLHAWQVFGQDLLSSHMSHEDLSEYVAAASADATRMFDDFAGQLGALRAAARFELAEGEPHRVIVDAVKGGRFDLVVIGTVARTGLTGFLMGNTAERVLRDLRGSVLAVKPAGFVSPITLDARAASSR